MHKTLLRAGCALALATPWAAQADTASDIAALRKEIETLRSSYEERLQSLEQRLKAAEGATSPNWGAPSAATAATGQPATASPEAAPASNAANAASAATTAAAGNGFNPSISLILSGLYARTSQDPARYAITGFSLPPDAEIGPGNRGFSLAESELGFAASIDPWWRGAANISVHGDNTVSVEEAYVQTTALGNGLSAKAGRFFSNVGYLNPQHSHT